MNAPFARSGVEPFWNAATLGTEAPPSWRPRPDLAVPIWWGLVGGHWTVVDQFDHDGRRHVLIRRNAQPTARPLPVLSERERRVASLAAAGQANKAIAFDLGLAPSTVSGVLARVAAKLGAPSRALALRAYAAMLGSDRPAALSP